MTDLGSVYGGALFELAAEEGRDGDIRQQLRQVLELLRQQPEYLKLLCTPSIPKAERCALLDQALRGRVDGYLLNFLKILCERGALRQLGGCEKEFSARYNEARGILPARAVSAVPLTRQDAERLREKLETLTGKRVDLSLRVDPACIGGVRLEMEGVRLDGTLQGRLARLRRELENTVL